MIVRLRNFCMAVALALTAVALTTAASPAQDGPYFEIIDPPVLDDPKNWGGTWEVTNGQVSLSLYDGAFRTGHGWSFDPATGAAGFDVQLHVSGAIVGCGPLAAGTGVSSDDFVFTDNVSGIELGIDRDDTQSECPERTKSAHGTIHLIPAAGTYAVGDKLSLHVGAAWGPGVTYTFTATRAGTADGRGGATTTTGGDSTGDDTGTLDATLDCPDSIVIGELPGLQCAIEITGYERNTSAPVVVSSPTELDGYGNTESGIQLSVLTGAADPSNWDQSYHWPFSPYACTRAHVGANCYDNVTTPGEKMIPIIVSQAGVGQVTLIWTVNALGGTEPTNGLPFDGAWSTSYGDMTIAVSGTDATGDYTYDGGKLYGTLDGAFLFGFWTQAGGSGRTCDSAYQGSTNWGQFVFILSDDGRTFTGTWGYCDDEPTRSGWDGARR